MNLNFYQYDCTSICFDFKFFDGMCVTEFPLCLLRVLHILKRLITPNCINSQMVSRLAPIQTPSVPPKLAGIKCSTIW